MKATLMAFGGMIAAIFMCSCGSLNQKDIGGIKLTEDDVNFAKNMVSEPNWSQMRMTFDGRRNYTDQWNSYAVPTFPVIYWTTLGNYNHDSIFGVRKVAAVVPAFYLIRDSVYNSQGDRIRSATEFNMAMVFGFEGYQNQDDSDWKFGFVWIPGLGPFLGFGSEFFQFLWIPFSDM